MNNLGDKGLEALSYIFAIIVIVLATKLRKQISGLFARKKDKGVFPLLRSNLYELGQLSDDIGSMFMNIDGEIATTYTDINRKPLPKKKKYTIFILQRLTSIIAEKLADNISQIEQKKMQLSEFVAYEFQIQLIHCIVLEIKDAGQQTHPLFMEKFKLFSQKKIKDFENNLSRICTSNISDTIKITNIITLYDISCNAFVDYIIRGFMFFNGELKEIEK